MKKATFQNKNILITGGLGFIGSNLAIKLISLGANVQVVDNRLPRQGANDFNLESVKGKAQVDIADIRDSKKMYESVKGKDYIFHLAGQVNHVESIKDPFKDVDINVNGTLTILEACRLHNKEAKIIFTGTRGQYGPTVKIPVSEDHPMQPKGIYAVTNMAAEKMLLVYHDVHGIKSICLRMTNTYGPRHQMRHDQYGVLNWFIRRAIDDEAIHVFGNGLILRDYLYVDDCIESLIGIALEEKAYGEVFNIGGGVPISFKDLAKKIVKICKSGKYVFSDFTQERKALEPGDYAADITKIKNLIGWKPTISLEDGITSTLSYYRQHKEKYW